MSVEKRTAASGVGSRNGGKKSSGEASKLRLVQCRTGAPSASVIAIIGRDGLLAAIVASPSAARLAMTAGGAR